MAIAVLSPHFDDAVLSCWHALRSPGDVHVVNVFAGVPGEGALGWWDRTTGARSAAARVAERAAEDREALGMAGRTAVGLDVLEAQHRAEAPDLADIARRVADAVGACDAVYAPAGLGRHPDHLLVRELALGLRAAVVLYADLPHAIRRGWPTWVGPPGDARVDDEWANDLGGLHRRGLRPEVHPLDEHERRRKLAAVRAYRTQIAELERMAFGPLSQTLRYEVTWAVVPRA